MGSISICTYPSSGLLHFKKEVGQYTSLNSRGRCRTGTFAPLRARVSMCVFLCVRAKSSPSAAAAAHFKHASQVTGRRQGEAARQGEEEEESTGGRDESAGQHACGRRADSSAITRWSENTLALGKWIRVVVCRSWWVEDRGGET